MSDEYQDLAERDCALAQVALQRERDADAESRRGMEREYAV